VADQNDRDRGFTKAVCTVGQSDNSTTTGKMSAPRAV
jgi:hypothetical protein